MSTPGAQEQRGLLNNDASNTPEPSRATLSATGSPAASFSRHRPGYARIPSVSVIDEQFLGGTTAASEEDDITQARSSTVGHGLGIAVAAAAPSKARGGGMQAPSRLQAASAGTPNPQTPSSTDPMISPPSTGGFSGSTRYDGPVIDFESSYTGPKHFAKQSVSSLHSTLPPSIYAPSDAGLVSVKSRYEEWEPHQNCRSHKRVKQNMGSWLSTVVLILAVFSTAFSATFLIIAMTGPRYGRAIHTNGALTASSAAFLTSFLAKLVELSFVTVLVAFIGQALARRAFKQEDARGVTLAELSMRNWILSPGTMVTQWESVRYAGITALGTVSIIAAGCAMLYTSAATALVQPQLKYPDWHPQTMQGLVKSEFSNPAYIAGNCKTPITTNYDAEAAGSTCIQLEHAAMGFHNYFSYLASWTDTINNGTGSSDLAKRPKGFALLNDNTTISAPWVEQSNLTDLWTSHGLIINNVSMAMPHPGVIQAALDPRNNIMQPAELDGLGTYEIRASVPSPVVHVLCVTMTNVTLKPFVYELWDDAKLPVDMKTWPKQLGYSDPYLNGTILDDIMQWGPRWGGQKWPPVFGRLPINFNTILNLTEGVPYGRDAVYLLGKGGMADSIGNPTPEDNYALCQLKVSQTPYCSTQYNASANGGTLAAVCEDNNELQYNNSMRDAPSGSFAVNKDWPNIASEWGRSLSLNDGYYDGNGSNARLLTQLILTGVTKLNPALPSMAEALAVMAGCTLLQSAVDAPFVGFWNYTLPTMTPGQYQFFNASVRAQQYASGGTQPYQKVFYIVLISVFVMNVIVLIYFSVHRTWYTDFSEPTTLFSLAVNSPPSKELAGSCGGGPVGEQFRVSWKLNSDGEHVFMESQEKEVPREESPGLRRRSRFSEGFDMMMSPIRRASEVFESRRSR